MSLVRPHRPARRADTASRYTWADAVVDDTVHACVVVPSVLPRDTGEDAKGHRSPGYADAWGRPGARGPAPGTGHLVDEFEVDYAPAVPAWAEQGRLAQLAAAVPVPDGAVARVIEWLSDPTPVRLEVAQWVVTRGRQPASGVVVLTFPDGWRLGVITGGYPMAPGGQADRRTVLAAARQGHLRDAKRVPVLRLSPSYRLPTSLSPADRQDRVDQWLTGLLDDIAADWVRQAAETVARAASTSRVQAALDRDEARFRRMGRCIYPLTDLGWRYSGRIAWDPPSQTFNDDDSWYLDADEDLGQPGLTWLRGDLYVDEDGDGGFEDYGYDDYGPDGPGAGVPPPGLCGAAGVDADGLCRIHAGLPYRNMNAKAWERAAAAVLARQQGEVYAAQARGAVHGHKRTFWTGDFHDHT